MSRRTVVAATLATVLVSTALLPAQSAPAHAATAAALATTDASDHVGDSAPGRLLVRFADDATEAQRSAAVAGAGATDVGAVGATSWRALTVTTSDLPAAAQLLREAPGVASVQLDHLRRGAGWPTDPELASGNPVRTALETARVDRAWSAGTGTGTVVAILDTGTAPHADLAGALLPGLDLVGTDPTGSSDDHGTQVSLLVAARAGNGIGSAGVAHGAQVLPIRVLDHQWLTPDSRLADGIARAVEREVDVINLSIAGPATSPVLLEAIQAATAAGVVVVAAAGNTGTSDPQYPAAYAPDVAGLLSVTATDGQGSLAERSTWGDTVTLAAPGVRTDGYAGGSSAATAVVSGVVALVRGHVPALTPAQVESTLVSTARDAGPRGFDPAYGAGVVDAAAAVTAKDARPAAPGVPFDRAVGDPGPSNDTRATARRITDDRVRDDRARGRRGLVPVRRARARLVRRHGGW